MASDYGSSYSTTQSTAYPDRYGQGSGVYSPSGTQQKPSFDPLIDALPSVAGPAALGYAAWGPLGALGGGLSGFDAFNQRRKADEERARIRADQERYASGQFQGEQANKYFDIVAPESTQFERIGSSAAGQVGSSASQAGLGASQASLQSQTAQSNTCLLYTSPSPRDRQKSRMPSSA